MLKNVAAILIAIGLGLSGCSRHPYSQETPDAVIRSAKLMVERGEAARLSDLLYAENEDMRRFYRRVGVMLGHLQELGAEIAKAYPQELAKLKADAEKAGKEGRATSLLQQLSGPGLRRNRNQPPGRDEQKQREAAFGGAIKRLFADPYAFLSDASGRLKTTEVNDELAAVLWDDQPILNPVGLTMRKFTAEGQTRWGVVLPWNLPVISKYAPRTPDEFKVLGSLVKTFDNAVIELTADVREKRVKSLDDVSRKAGEKLFVPAAMVFYAYTRAVDARPKEGKPTPPGR